MSTGFSSATYLELWINMDDTCDFFFVTGRIRREASFTANSCSSHDGTLEAGSEAENSTSLQQRDGNIASCAHSKSRSGRLSLWGGERKVKVPYGMKVPIYEPVVLCELVAPYEPIAPCDSAPSRAYESLAPYEPVAPCDPAPSYEPIAPYESEIRCTLRVPLVLHAPWSYY